MKNIDIEKRKEEILNAHKFRFACKEFDPDRKISEEDFKFLLEVGRLSPSSFGFEPWKFLVVENKELKERLLPAVWGVRRQMPTLSHLVIILARKGSEVIYSADYITHMMRDVHKMSEDKIKERREKYRVFQNEDFKILNSEKDMFEWSIRQTYIALGNMMTAAAEIGIDSCPIEGFNKEELEKLLESEGVLDREKFGVSTLIAFGYRKENPHREKTRRPMEDVVRWIK